MHSPRKKKCWIGEKKKVPPPGGKKKETGARSRARSLLGGGLAQLLRLLRLLELRLVVDHQPAGVGHVALPPLPRKDERPEKAFARPKPVARDKVREKNREGVLGFFCGVVFRGWPFLRVEMENKQFRR